MTIEPLVSQIFPELSFLVSLATLTKFYLTGLKRQLKCHSDIALVAFPGGKKLVNADRIVLVVTRISSSGGAEKRPAAHPTPETLEKNKRTIACQGFCLDLWSRKSYSHQHLSPSVPFLLHMDSTGCLVNAG